MGYNGFCGDDDDEKTDPGIGPARGQSVMSGGCSAESYTANPASVYTDPNKKSGGIEIDRDQPRTYSYSWTPKGESEFKKDETIPPPRDTQPVGNAATTTASRYGSGVSHDYYGGGGSHYTRNATSSSSNYGPNRDNFHSGSGMGYKAPPPPEDPKEIFIYDSTPGSMIRRIMERDGFLRLAKTKPEWKYLDINKGEYPAMSERGKTAVVGEVYNAVPRTLKMLDSMLDTPTTFKREVISLEDGKRVYAYVMPSWKTPSTYMEVSVDSGNWALWKKGERGRHRIAKVAEAEKKKKDAEEYAARRQREIDERAKWEKKYSSSSSSKDSKDPKKKRVHISTISAIELRVMLHSNGLSTDNMQDKDVRVECIRRYGSWYLVDV